jgi:hypothetical protein
MAGQVICEDGQWEVLKLPNSSVQVLNGLPCSTQSNSSLPHVMPPNGLLPSDTPSRKRARAACNEAEGSQSENATMSEADPNQQPAAVRVCRQSASVQMGAPVGRVERTPADPVVHCSAHSYVQERMSPEAEPITGYGNEPDPPTLAQHANSASGNYETRQEGGAHSIIEDEPSPPTFGVWKRRSKHFDQRVKRNSALNPIIL